LILARIPGQGIVNEARMPASPPEWKNKVPVPGRMPAATLNTCKSQIFLSLDFSGFSITLVTVRNAGTYR
jgi:hypothetical protein